MAEKSTHAHRLLLRVLGALAALSLVAALSPVAGAQTSTEERLDDAEAEFDRLVAQYHAHEDRLEQLMVEAAAIAQRVADAQGRYEQITEDLRNTTLALRRAQDEFARLQEELDTRARETFMAGPGTELEFLLGASSLSDLSARIEYVNAISETEVDLATAVQNLKNELAARRDDEQALQEKAARALRQWETQQAAVDANLAEQQRVLESLEEAKREAGALVERLTRRHRRELRALTGLGGPSDGIFEYCPVAPPRAVYDGFGAPRYGGGYHPHAGNDIMAPMGTPVIATFDGTARTSTNTLGGYAVHVYGEHGYTYNAHLMQPGVNGYVNAGDIIGYVGTSGNATTPHNHFEWHPNVVPEGWPASPYGYAVIGTGSNAAVNPWPLLSQVC